MLFTPLQIALNALRRNKIRTVLTVLGIVIGISAVITVISAGEGIKSFVLKQIETYGNDLIQTEVKVPSTSHLSAENAISMAMGVEVTTLKLSDEKAIKELPNIKNTYAALTGQQLVSYEGQKKQIILFGVSSSFNEIDKTKVVSGRFFTDDEDRSLANVAVLGPKVKEKLFFDDEAVGKWVRIGRDKFKVIGVMESRGQSFGFDMDEMIFVPVRTLQKKIMGVDHLAFIMSQVYDANLTSDTAAEITALMRERHNIFDPDKDDFAVTPMTQAIEIINSVFWAISLLLMTIAGISLVVGGVGIMNIMYVSVMERTYEIGLRKAVGATGNNILFQFLWEAIVVTLLGAIIGIVWGALLAFVISVVANSLGFAWQFVVLPSSLLLACSVAIGIGLIFGIFPARAASKMEPVEALRYNK